MLCDRCLGLLRELIADPATYVGRDHGSAAEGEDHTRAQLVKAGAIVRAKDVPGRSS